MQPKLRYPIREAREQLGIGNTKFWRLVKAGALQVHYDGNKGYCTHATLERYVASSQANTTSPAYKPKAKPGTKGVQAP
jgi:hypothetical protein